MSVTAPHLVPLVPVSDLAVGSSAVVEAQGLRLLVVHTDEGWFVTGADCTHAGAPLQEGRTLGCLLVCPWHEAVFHLRSGAVERGPARRPLRSYPVTVTDGMVAITVASEEV